MLRRIMLALALLGLTVPSTRAVEIWGARSTSAWGNQLVHYDSDHVDETLAVIGYMFIEGHVSGLDFVNGDLYAWDATGNGDGTVPPGLWSVDCATGRATRVGGDGVQADERIADLTFNPRDGLLYGIACPRTWSGPNSLYTIDPATGTATRLGSLGGLENNYAVGLAANGDGDMYVQDLERLTKPLER